MKRSYNAKLIYWGEKFTDRPWLAFIGLVVLSATINIGATLALGITTDIHQLDADEREYYLLSQDLLDGNYEFQSRRVLGHVILLAGIQALTGGNIVAEQILITFIFSLTAPLTFLLVRKMLAHNNIALLASLMAIFWPLYIIYGGSFYSETTALPIFILFLLLLPRGSRLNTETQICWWQWLSVGILLGICLHMRPMYLLFCPFAVLIIFWEESRFLPALKASILLTIGCLVVVLPWSIYVSINEGKPVLLSTNGGETIAGGINPYLIESGYQSYHAPDGRLTWTGPGKWVNEHDTGYLSKKEMDLPRLKRDKLLVERAVNWAVDNPGKFIYLESAKLLYMWGVYPFWNGFKQTVFGNIPTILILILGVISLWQNRSNWRQLARFWTLPIFVSIVALISWGSWRFRQPGDLGLIVLAALLFIKLIAKDSQLDNYKSQR